MFKPGTCTPTIPWCTSVDTGAELLTLLQRLRERLESMLYSDPTEEDLAEALEEATRAHLLAERLVEELRRCELTRHQTSE